MKKEVGLGGGLYRGPIGVVGVVVDVLDGPFAVCAVHVRFIHHLFLQDLFFRQLGSFFFALLTKQIVTLRCHTMNEKIKSRNIT
jgi:hypothetical protein